MLGVVLGKVALGMFLLKLLLHVFLMAKVKEGYLDYLFTRATGNSVEVLKPFFPFYEDVPARWKRLKTGINGLYVGAIFLGLLSEIVRIMS